MKEEQPSPLPPSSLIPHPSSLLHPGIAMLLSAFGNFTKFLLDSIGSVRILLTGSGAEKEPAFLSGNVRRDRNGSSTGRPGAGEHHLLRGRPAAQSETEDEAILCW